MNNLFELKKQLFEELCIRGSGNLNDYEIELRDILRDDPDIKRYIRRIADKILARFPLSEKSRAVEAYRKRTG